MNLTNNIDTYLTPFPARECACVETAEGISFCDACDPLAGHEDLFAEMEPYLDEFSAPPTLDELLSA